MGRIVAILLVVAAVIAPAGAATLTARDLFSDLGRFNDTGLALIEGIGYQQGAVTIPAAGVRLDVPSDFYFLEQTDANRVLTEGWGNPIGQTKDVVGMIFPARYTPLDPDNWGAALIYEDEGHVDDSDAARIDFAALLERMKTDVAAANAERRFNGFAEATLLGWAAPPSYDRRSHTLTWAREIAFAGRAETTINYSIRFLGRTGILSLTFVGRKRQFAEMRQAVETVRSMAEFLPGGRYGDFDAKIDRKADYGLAGLIMGKAAVADSGWGTLVLRIALGALGVVGIAGGLIGWRLKQRRAAQPPRRRI
jgi:uncharacterized membrane-anchored protein